MFEPLISGEKKSGWGPFQALNSKIFLVYRSRTLVIKLADVFGFHICEVSDRILGDQNQSSSVSCRRQIEYSA
jgi:hypothetical protein